MVVLSVAAELVLAIVHPSYDSLWNRWGTSIADALIALGIIGEVLFGRLDGRYQTELRRRSNDKLGEAISQLADANNRLADIEFELAYARESAAMATERAAEADLKRAELEAKLLPRALNQEQWDFIQGLRGKFAEVSIAYETDAETRWFAGQIRDAFFSAGIRVGIVARAAEVHSFGMLIYEPSGFDGARPRTVEPLVEVFKMADVIGALAIITEIPLDIIFAIYDECSEMRPLLNAPMIIVGGRFVIPPPHLERAAKEARATMSKQASTTPETGDESGE